MTSLLLVAGLIAGMEACRIGWHGRWRCDPVLFVLHLVAICGLQWITGARGLAPWALLSLAAAAASYLTLIWRDDLTPRLWQARVTLWLGRPIWFRPSYAAFHSRLNLLLLTDRWHVLSLLSALPIQVAAVLAVCWPLPGWQRWAALAAFALEGIAIKKWLWTWDRLVPQHWRR